MCCLGHVYTGCITISIYNPFLNTLVFYYYYILILKKSRVSKIRESENIHQSETNLHPTNSWNEENEKIVEEKKRADYAQQK